MRKPIVITMSLVIAGMMIASASAFSFPSGLSSMSLPQLSSPAMSSNLGAISAPVTSSQVSTPSTPFGSSNWGLNNLQFFQPSRATAQPPGSSGLGIPASDVGPILQLMSQLPSPEQLQQYQNPTPTPAPVNTFTSISQEIPADQVIFLEVSKNIVFIDASAQGFKVPTVTMNYQYDDKNKKLLLKNKGGTDISGAKIIVGYTRQDDRDSTYLFDYNIGSVPYDDIPIVFTGSDGRVSIILNGTQKDLMPGEKAELTTQGNNLMTTITVSNFGLVPKSNIELKDKL
ncbi:hypothetical protein [Methanocella arvoryzae]|uniref:hypothetical protein n=1 Tax=Methanocella arvoryzae TaxID=1175445 RepID=UPI0011D27543|nr:hypothetical protein [Methanocella arvoryzae]